MFLKAGDNQFKASIYIIYFCMRKAFLVNVKNNNNKENFIHTKAKCNYHSKQIFSFFSLAESPPRDLQITAYK